MIDIVALVIIYVLGLSIVGLLSAVVVATIMDIRVIRKAKRDIFYQLSRDHNRVKRPARK